ncbi:hypothetical protein IMAU80128_03387 [Lactiplantibacillus plantarum]|nr:hypothetical protein [Lactiplantibacillus plantarum]
MRPINIYDAETKQYMATQLLADEDDMPDNATTVMLPSNQMITDIHKYVFDGSGWTGGSAINNSTTEQQALTAMAQKMADQQQHIESLEQALTALAEGGTKS